MANVDKVVENGLIEFLSLIVDTFDVTYNGVTDKNEVIKMLLDDEYISETWISVIMDVIIELDKQ